MHTCNAIIPTHRCWLWSGVTEGIEEQLGDTGHGSNGELGLEWPYVR